MKALPYLAYLFLAGFFFDQLPSHEELIHVEVTSSWRACLEYWCHPPSYVLLGRLFRVLFVDDYRGLYLLGLSAALANIHLAGRLARTLLLSRGCEKTAAERAALAARWLCAICPVFIHGSLLLEMEPVVVTPFVLWTLNWRLEFRREPSARRYAVLGLILFGAMWGKYFLTPHLLLLALFLDDVLSSTPLRPLLRSYALVIALSSGLFLLSYLAYSHFFIPGTNSFEFLMLDKPKEGLPLFRSWRIILPPASKALAMTFWFSPFLLLLLPAAIRRDWGDGGRGGLARPLWIFVLLVLIFYSAAHPYLFTEIKYLFPIFPVLLVLIAADTEVYTDWTWRGLLPLPLFAVAALFAFGDPLFSVVGAYREAGFPGVVSPLISYLAAIVLLGAAAVLLFQSFVPGLLCRTKILLILAGAHMFSMLLSQACGGYQTKYHYGEVGYKETIAYITAQPAGMPMALASDILWYDHGRHPRAELFSGNTIMADPPWEQIVEKRYELHRLPEVVRRKIESIYKVEREIGSFTILRRNEYL